MVQFVTHKKYGSRCLPHVKRFLDDDEKDVRQETLSVLDDERLWEQAWTPDFLRQLASSRAGLDGAVHLLWRLKDQPDHPERFAEVLFALTDTVLTDADRPADGTDWLR
jgi:GH15 family glucan-1,4-alpha-glucosidase